MHEHLHRLVGTTVSLVVMHALALVKGLLHARLLVVGLDATGEAVTNISGALLHLLLGGLGGVGSELLLGLCEEVSETFDAASCSCMSTYWCSSPCVRRQTCLRVV